MDFCCIIGADSEANALVQKLRDEGIGYRKVYRRLKAAGYPFSRERIQEHCQHVPRNIMSAMGDAEDQAEVEIGEDWLAARGLSVPDAYTLIAGTITELGANGLPSWLRVKPKVEELPEDRIELRQAQPLVLEGQPKVGLTIHVPGDWITALVTPDLQCGYWINSNNELVSMHDEAALSVVHQVAWAIAEDEGLDIWADCGDFIDDPQASRWTPTTIDTQVRSLNATWQRASEELGRRRNVVGPEGEVIVLDGNHTTPRLNKKASQEMPWLVGMQRAGEEDEYPLYSIPYLIRAKDYAVEWITGYGTRYRLLNSNLAIFHSVAYGSKALDSARKTAATIHCSVVHGHSHRAATLHEGIETTRHGQRTLIVWSDGCLCRTDGSVPSQKSAFDEWGNRLLVPVPNGKVGQLSEAWQQGASIIHVETTDRHRFSVENFQIWSGWTQFRGQQFQAACDVDGNPLEVAA